jgi:hypothetical protein
MMKKLYVSAAAIAIACAGVGAMAASKPAKSTSFDPFNVTKPARYVIPASGRKVTPVVAPAPAPVAAVRPPYRPPPRSPFRPPVPNPFPGNGGPFS